MQFTNFNMIDNSVKNAMSKLMTHKVEGQESGLTIFQVAKLMDTIKFNKKEEGSGELNFSLN